MTIIFTLLLGILVILLTFYDFRTVRIPNWVTFPLLLVGVLAHFPGTVETWLGCILLFLGWRSGWIGGGDAKLWIALVWNGPMSLAGAFVVVALLSMAGTGFLQLAWRKWRGKAVFGTKSPAAWRAIPFVLCLIVQSIIVV